MSKKQKQSTRGGLSGFVASYNAKEAGGTNYGNTALKSVVDAVLGVPVGIAIGGAAGLWSLPFGALLIAAGHHFKDHSGLLRITGASAIAYGVAKNVDFNNAAKAAKASGVSGFAGTTQGVKDRLKTVKDELLSAYFLDKIFKKKETAPPAGTPVAKMAELDESETVGAIDLSSLDMFDEFNKEQADGFNAELAEREFYEYENREPSNEAIYNVYDDEEIIDPSDY
jgi:hypothetical protein